MTEHSKWQPNLDAFEIIIIIGFVLVKNKFEINSFIRSDQYILEIIVSS